MMKMKWKKRGALLLALTLICSVLTAGPIASAEELPPISVLVDGEQIAFDVQPIFEADRVLVPMRFIFEALGAEVTWDDDLQKATAVKGDIVIEITIDDAVMLKNGGEVILDVPARLVGERTLVPVRAVSEGMNAEVDWIDETQQVVIVTKEAQSEPTARPTAPAATKKPEATKAPAATRKPNTSDPKDGTYGADSLSPEDMEALKASYNNMIRYTFEQSALPQKVLVNNAEITKQILAGSEEAKTAVRDTWNQVVMKRIIDIQLASETTYDITGSDTMMEDWLAIAEEAGLEASDYFDVTFEPLGNGNTMMLVTFKKTDTLLACKYIGVVVCADKTVRYFTAETDLMDKDHLFICEVFEDGRANYGFMGFEKSSFVDYITLLLMTTEE